MDYISVIDSDFSVYLRPGQSNRVLNPSISVHWSVTKFTISMWVRPDRVRDDDDEEVDIIHLTVDR